MTTRSLVRISDTLCQIKGTSRTFLRTSVPKYSYALSCVKCAFTLDEELCNGVGKIHHNCAATGFHCGGYREVPADDPMEIS